MANLYIVATPIGNLEDITLRALRILKEVDLILAEDTRTTRKLLDKYHIRTPVERFDARIEAKNSGRVLDLLNNKKDLALVSDAGTPGISDPGGPIVQKVRVEVPEVEIIPIPGASSLTTALSVAGLSQTEFTFLGFLPHKKGRETLFKKIAEYETAVVFLESPHRVLKTLSSLNKFVSNKDVIIARELTKIHEEVKTGTAEELLKYFEENKEKQKGEFVIIVEPAGSADKRR
jgi:16S rRNA (cytidine1402-2'-O)-methyltransferase